MSDHVAEYGLLKVSSGGAMATALADEPVGRDQPLSKMNGDAAEMVEAVSLRLGSAIGKSTLTVFSETVGICELDTVDSGMVGRVHSLG